MTALAIFGSPISTSLALRGRSMTTDLPTPSGRKRVRTGMLDVTIGAACGSTIVAGSFDVGAEVLVAEEAAVVAGGAECGSSAAPVGPSLMAHTRTAEVASTRKGGKFSLFSRHCIRYPWPLL